MESDDLVGSTTAVAEFGDVVGEAACLSPRGRFCRPVGEGRRDLGGRRIGGDRPADARRHDTFGVVMLVSPLRDAQERNAHGSGCRGRAETPV